MKRTLLRPLPCCVAALLPLRVLGAASAPLLGGRYVPTTDVEYITDLVEIVEAIAEEDDKDSGEDLYRKVPPDSALSLLSISGAEDTSSVPEIYLDSATNPLYGIYMHALWNSHHGSSDGRSVDQPRAEMTFLGESVDYYGHKIITDEFESPSAYDPRLTSETIQVTSVWMAAVQSLYDAVDQCDNGDGVTTEPNYVSPVDIAAAFWFGNLDDTDLPTWGLAQLEGSGTMYAWAERARRNFDFGTTPAPFDANEEIVAGLVSLQGMLMECLDPNTLDDDAEGYVRSMKELVDDIARAMTVPLVQSLIHHAGTVAMEEARLEDEVQEGASESDVDAHTVDYMILYGLVTLPPIEVCDESVYDDLYSLFVVEASQFDSPILYDALGSLYDHLICLGITCDQIGEAVVLAEGSWPICEDPHVDLWDYEGIDPDMLLEYMKIDLDVRTIGILVEVEAETAAYDVYRWGRNSRGEPARGYSALQAMALEKYHEKNAVGKKFGAYFDGPAEFAARHEYQAMLGLREFGVATPTQRRIIAEAAMVTTTLQAFALNCMYKAIDACNEEDADDLNWDRAIASLSGWKEATGARGFLFMEIARFLCEGAGTCSDDTGESEINLEIIDAMELGKRDLEGGNCAGAEEGLKEVERLLQTALVDVTAYLADLIAQDSLDADMVAEGFGVATALVPLMDTSDAAILERNMGLFGTPPLGDGYTEVIAALARFATQAGLDCSLLTMDIGCGPGGGAVQEDKESTAPMEIPTGWPTAQEVDRDPLMPAPLLGGRYMPTTDVEYVTDLMEILEEIGKVDDKARGMGLYKKVPPGSTHSLLSISGAEDTSSNPEIYLDSATNPLYGIYMHALWGSHHGSSNGRSVDQPRAEMTFLGESVDYYGHKIIVEEFSKKSEYNPRLSSETIQVSSVWMAAVQSLYDAVDQCDDGDAVITDPDYVSPVDIAAAFWFGNLDDTHLLDATGLAQLEGSGTMYAWVERTRRNFNFGSTPAPFDANKEIVDGLVSLQGMLEECLDPNVPDDGEDKARSMKVLVDDATRAMTVPLVQSLIHYSGTVAMEEMRLEEEVLESDVDPNLADYMILYGLVTLPPIALCDEYVFDDLYSKFVVEAADFNSTVMYDALGSLYDRLICLGITCDQIGEAAVLAGGSWPICVHPQVNLWDYEGTDPDTVLEYMKIDLDVRTIGVLVEVEAETAAYDVYQWGRHSKGESMGGYSTLQAIGLEDYHEKNAVGKKFGAYSDGLAGFSGYAARHEYQAIMGLGKLGDATPTQRRIIAEATLVTITLHAFALNCMYKAIDACYEEDLDDLLWARAFASLSGWGEEATEGFLFMEIARFLCREAGTCSEDTGESEINLQLVAAMEGGKRDLEGFNCAGAEEEVKKVELLLQTVLVDVTAYFADLIAQDSSDVDMVTEGFGVAAALVPLMDPSDAAILERNMGLFGTVPLKDGYLNVIVALAKFAMQAGVDCSLMTRDIGCDPGGAAVQDDELTAPTEMAAGGEPTRSPVTFDAPTAQDFETDLPTPDIAEYDEDYTVGGTRGCGSGVDGGVPSSLAGSAASGALLGGEYTPTSKVFHIVELTKLVEGIENTTDKTSAIATYTKQIDGVSLQCLSTGVKWLHITKANPLYVIYMYGLWNSDLGGNDGDGLSNKVFIDGPIVNYGDAMVMDMIDESSDFDAKVSAETVRVANMWMAMATELYRAAESCRDGYVNKAPAGFNPVDFAAAFWYGNLQNTDLMEGGSLYAWAKRIQYEFADQSSGVNQEIGIKLAEMQQAFKECKSVSEDQQETKGIEMKHMADGITNWMIVPLVQKLIHHLATASGLEDKSDNESSYMGLYALAVLPFISICDDDLFDDLFTDLVTDIDEYDSGTFKDHIEMVYTQFECLGITCDMVGASIYSDESWPECKDPSVATANIAGYTPTSEYSLETLKIDLDISTILSFIIMEARDAALDIYENGRNAKDKTNSHVSLKTISIPSGHPDAIAIYKKFSSDYNVDYTSVTMNAIIGKEEFQWLSVLDNADAASLAISTIDMHMNILDHMYQAIQCSNNGQSKVGWNYHWDEAVASAVGWTETVDTTTATIDRYLFFQLAQELCGHYQKCDSDGQSIVNIKLMEEFKNGQEKLSANQCAEANVSKDNIEKYLQAILVDSLAYHSRFADSSQDDRHCLMAHVAKNALVPLIRPLSALIADTIETNVVATADECHVSDVDVVYEALHNFVIKKQIECSLLMSSVCSEAGLPDTNDLGNTPEYAPNIVESNPNAAENEPTYLLNNEYEPMADVTELQGISAVVKEICNAVDTETAKNKYTYSDAMTIRSMSISAKYAMFDELQLHQYVYALHDNVDKTGGSLLFDGKPATEYANTITSKLLDKSIRLGCHSMKVLNIWMWIVHKLNDAVKACKGTIERSYGHLDEAAALWDGIFFQLAEDLGPKFVSNDPIEGMASLNRQIVNRLKKSRGIIFQMENECGYDEIHELRITVKETISFMTAVLIQSLIDSMLDAAATPEEKEEMVKLMAFAVLPHIKTCGHEAIYNDLFKDLTSGGFDERMVGLTIGALQSHYNCLGLTCADVGRHTQAFDSYPQCSENLNIIGYAPMNAAETNMIAKLDLDTVAIHQLMSMGKDDIAKRIYLEGHNYYDYDLLVVSLHNMTQSHTIGYTAFSTYELYDNYLGSDFGNQLIIDAFDKAGPFQNTTVTQQVLAVNVAISSFVSYMAALEAFYLAVSICGSDINKAEMTFDSAVALLVGSVEGSGRGGSAFQEGQMFYSMSKRTCEHHHSCRGGDAEVNVELFRVLTEGKDFIQQGNCEGVEEAVESINALLKVPLMQSLLYFSDSTISLNPDNNAAGYVATMAVLPIINDIDPSSADRIKLVTGSSASSSFNSERKENTVISSMSVVFSKPGTASVVDCELVTNFDEICNPDKVDDRNNGANEGGEGSTTPGDLASPGDVNSGEAIDREAPMPFSNGLYVATNYVGDRSSIALDMQEIEKRFQANDFDMAKHYYDNGLNSRIYNKDGIPTTEFRSISHFSLDSGDNMKGDPTYNLFIYGLSDENQEFLGRPATRYADSFISDLLNSESREAASAMVAITIWMQVAHSLHSAYAACKNSFLADGRTIDRRVLQNNDPALKIDEAAAYWIGDSQVTGSSTVGHLLYALTESIGEVFEKIPSGSESSINSAIIDLFNKAKNHIAISRGCSTSKDSHLELKDIIDELITLMAIPLMRCLLYYMSMDEPKMAQVYATAVLPLFSVCSPSTYKELKDELIDQDIIEIQKSYLYSKIQSMYSCLGLTCKMVGFMPNDDVLRCDDSTESKRMAGYRFATDQVTINSASHIDVELNKVGMFMDNGIYHFPESIELLFGTAFDLYKYGQHSSYTKGSLSSLARDSNRYVVPAFASFRRYFSSDDIYADTMLVNAFQQKGIFKKATASQRKRVILFSLKYMVTYMAILEKLYNSVQSCKDKKPEQATMNLDLAAGYFIGSMEGKDVGGTFDGDLIFMLAKRMCVYFGTCAQSNNARINEHIINLLYAGQGEIKIGACNSLQRTVKEIENSLMVPLIQGVIFSARGNYLYFSKAVATEYYPEGYALAQSILPIISNADPDSARDIENVMVTFFPVRSKTDLRANDYSMVHNAMQNAIIKMKLDCSEIGNLSGHPGFCPEDEASSGPGLAFSLSLSFSVVLPVMAGIVFFVLH